MQSHHRLIKSEKKFVCKMNNSPSMNIEAVTKEVREPVRPPMAFRSPNLNPAMNRYLNKVVIRGE